MTDRLIGNNVSREDTYYGVSYGYYGDFNARQLSEEAVRYIRAEERLKEEYKTELFNNYDPVWVETEENPLTPDIGFKSKETGEKFTYEDIANKYPGM